MEKKIKEQLVRKYYSRYLPYNVRVLFDNTTEGILCGIRTGIFDLEVIEEYDNDTPIIKTWCSSDTKLILRRFDLSKEIEHDGEKIIPIEAINSLKIVKDFGEAFDLGVYKITQRGGVYHIKAGEVDELPSAILEKLIEWNFDVFDLHNLGLAVYDDYSISVIDEEIINAYGEYWNGINVITKKAILNNFGFMYFSRYEEYKTPSDMFGIENVEKTFDYGEELAGERPKTLSHLPKPE